MPTNPSYPGVYIEELPGGVHSIEGVSTSVTAFVGRTLRGPVDKPLAIFGFADYKRTFGGLWKLSPMSYSVQQYFENGGSHALVVRVHRNAKTATAKLLCEDRGREAPALTLKAANPGGWGSSLRVTVSYGAQAIGSSCFSLRIELMEEGAAVASETFLDVSTERRHPRLLGPMLTAHSQLVRVKSFLTATRPAAATVSFTVGANADGRNVTSNEILSGARLEHNRKGMHALECPEQFNVLCIPPFSFGDDVDVQGYANAIAFCEKRGAILLVDPPSTAKTAADATVFVDTLDKSSNAAFFFPRVLCPNELEQGRLDDFAPCGAVAGVLARTDSTRGVWNSSAGRDAKLHGVSGLSTMLTDVENDELNAKGINCLRDFQSHGRVVWGARTLAGSSQSGSEWKYLAVKRTALFVEESIFRGTMWAVFEPNGEPLWSQIRLGIGDFLHELFGQGAFQGRTPSEAYFVKVGHETSSQSDIDAGVLNIIVAFAPLKPAEFLIINIQQLAGAMLG